MEPAIACYIIVYAYVGIFTNIMTKMTSKLYPESIFMYLWEDILNLIHQW